MKTSLGQADTNRDEDAPVWFLRPRLLMAFATLALAVGYPMLLHRVADVGVDPTIYQNILEDLDELYNAEAQVAVGEPQKKLGFLIIAGTAAVLLVAAVARGVLRVGDLGLLMLAYVGWAALSTTWSESPTLTIRELVRLATTVGLALGLASNFSLRDVAGIVAGVAVGSIVMAFGLELSLGAFRPWGGEYRFAGGIHANSLGLHAAVLLTASVALLTGRPSSRWLWFCMLLALATLLLTKSRTSLGCGLFSSAVAATVAFGFRRTVIYWCIAGLTSAMGLLALGVSNSSTIESATGTALLGREEGAGSLSGRVPLWINLVQDVAERPVRGHGYKAFWSPSKRVEIGDQIGWYPPEAHCAYFDVLIQLGLVGLLLFLSMGLMTIVRLATDHRIGVAAQTGRAFLSGIVGLAIVHGFLESTVSEARVTGLTLAAGLFSVARPFGLLSLQLPHPETRGPAPSRLAPRY